jgi:hypothetical protein
VITYKKVQDGYDRSLGTAHARFDRIADLDVLTISYLKVKHVGLVPEKMYNVTLCNCM